MNLRDAAAELAQGLTTEPQKILNMMLRDFDPYLSLRRIPEGDPAFAHARSECLVMRILVHDGCRVKCVPDFSCIMIGV